jgi:polysaccharide biosynthesis/export protein
MAFKASLAITIACSLALTMSGCGMRANETVSNRRFTPSIATPQAAGAITRGDSQADAVVDVVTADLPLSYRIGPLDELKIVVFKEPDLSSEDLPVDLSGTIALPLIGQIAAQGKTAAELTSEITRRLNERYLRDAQVAVSVTRPVNYSVTVEGEVKKPGVFQIPGSASLLQAIAMGEGLNEYARPSEIIVFRQTDGKRYAARFDLRHIRDGVISDPMLQQGDIVVVGYSRAARFQRDIVQALPGLASTFILLLRR